MRPEIIIPAHNYLPTNKRILDGSDVEKFLYASLESVFKLLVISESILDKPVTLGEFTQRLLNEYGVKRKIYPQALITAEAIVKYFGKRIIKIREGETVLYSIRR
jgi:hypothetical protein